MSLLEGNAVNDVLEFAKSVGGIGSILIFVLFGAYWIFKPLIDDWRELVRNLVKDQKEARELFTRELGDMRLLARQATEGSRQERAEAQLAHQREMSAVAAALDRMSDTLQEAMNGHHIAENAPTERGKDRSGLRSRPASAG